MARYRAGIETRARILAATKSLLGEAGLDGTTLKAICERAEVRAGSFYNLFHSKEEAVLTVVREAIEGVDPHPDGEGRDTIEELVAAYVRFLTTEPNLARIYLQIAVNGGLTDEDLRERMLRSHHYRVERFSDALARTRPELSSAEARVGAEQLLAALHGLGFVWMLDHSFDLEGHTRRLLAEHATV